MYRPLVPCPECSRHVVATETNCPFCSAALPKDLETRVIPGAGRRLSRAAAFVFGASLTIAGCGDAIEIEHGSGDPGQDGGTGTDSGPDDDGGVVALYGDPPPPDDGGPAPLYGTPPPLDAGTIDDGGAFPLYGAPPPVDAGVSDGGGGVPAYGAPSPNP